jgi:hypothetical protein
MDGSSPAPAPVVALAARREHLVLPVLAVIAVLAVVVLGGYVVGGALSTPAGPPVDVSGNVRVQPLSGWEVAGRFGEPTPGVRLTRGSGNLDVVTVPFDGSPSDLANEYVTKVLEPEADRLSVSREVEQVELASGLQAVRFAYVGMFGKAQVPIEGDVTAVVSPSGTGVVFDGWAPQGMLQYAVDDVRTMVDGAAIA